MSGAATVPEVPVSPEREVPLRRLGHHLHELQQRGFDNYVGVPAWLSELGLRQPIAPMTGPNVAARGRGVALLETALRAAVSAPCVLGGLVRPRAATDAGRLPCLQPGARLHRCMC